MCHSLGFIEFSIQLIPNDMCEIYIYQYMYVNDDYILVYFIIVYLSDISKNPSIL